MHADPGGPLDEILGQTERACQRAVVLSTQLLTFSKGGAPIRRVASVSKLLAGRGGPGPGGRRGQHQPRNRGRSVVRGGRRRTDRAGPAQHPAEREAGLARRRRQWTCGPRTYPRNRTLRSGQVQWFRITVSDHGSGIDAEVLPLIFDPYFTTKGSGSGLGLATAYAIVVEARRPSHRPIERRARAPPSSSMCRRPRLARPSIRRWLPWSRAAPAGCW